MTVINEILGFSFMQQNNVVWGWSLLTTFKSIEQYFPGLRLRHISFYVK